MFNNNLIDNSIDFLFDNSFSFGFDNLFSGGGGGGVKNLNYNNKAIYQIQNFNNLQNKSEYNINRKFENEDNKSEYNMNRKFENEDNKSEYNMNRKFNNKDNFAFYKLGIIQIPPKRITIKGFDD